MDIENFTLRQVAYFVAIAETGSIYHAADRLHVSQSAVSSALNELERILDAQLFVRRKAKGVTLTPSGQRALVQARTLLREAGELPIVASSSGLAGPIDIGCFASLSPIVLPALLQGFTAEYPDVRLSYTELSRGAIEDRLHSGDIDVGIAHDWGIPSDFTRSLLTSMRPYLLLPAEHWALERESVSLTELAGETLVTPAVNPSKDHTLSILRGAGVEPASTLEATSFELTRALVGRGLGYAISVQRSSNPYSHEGLPVYSREIADDVDPVRVVLVWLRTVPLTARLKAFVDYSLALDWESGHPA